MTHKQKIDKARDKRLRERNKELRKFCQQDPKAYFETLKDVVVYKEYEKTLS
jgi:hypothetical protein